MASLIDSEFRIGDEIWYINGNTINYGVIATVIYNYKTEEVRYKLRKDESEMYDGYVTENRVFASEELAKSFLASHPYKRIEKESDLLAAIESYIDLGENAKAPLFIKLCEGWGRYEVKNYLDEKYNPLGVDGHPFKRGHKFFINQKGETELISDHPELTTNFLPPSGFDALHPPRFFICNKLNDDPKNPAYYLDCVKQLNIPFVYIAPYVWSNHSDKSWHKDDPRIVSGFEIILYEPTVKGWLKDMWDVKSKLPNQNRLIESTNNYSSLLRGFVIDNDYNVYKEMREKSKKLCPHFLEQRIKFILEYADSIKDLESYDDLTDINPFRGTKPDYSFASIPYLLEKLMTLYYNMYIGRVLCPQIKVSEAKFGIARQNISNLCNSFTMYLEKTEDNWVFDFSKPVPEAVLRKAEKILTEDL